MSQQGNSTYRRFLRTARAIAPRTRSNVIEDCEKAEGEIGAIFSANFKHYKLERRCDYLASYLANNRTLSETSKTSLVCCALVDPLLAVLPNDEHGHPMTTRDLLVVYVRLTRTIPWIAGEHELGNHDKGIMRRWLKTEQAFRKLSGVERSDMFGLLVEQCEELGVRDPWVLRKLVPYLNVGGARPLVMMVTKQIEEEFPRDLVLFRAVAAVADNVI